MSYKQLISNDSLTYLSTNYLYHLVIFDKKLNTLANLKIKLFFDILDK